MAVSFSIGQSIFFAMTLGWLSYFPIDSNQVQHFIDQDLKTMMDRTVDIVEMKRRMMADGAFGFMDNAAHVVDTRRLSELLWLRGDIGNGGSRLQPANEENQKTKCAVGVVLLMGLCKFFHPMGFHTQELGSPNDASGISISPFNRMLANSKPMGESTSSQLSTLKQDSNNIQKGHLSKLKDSLGTLSLLEAGDPHGEDALSLPEDIFLNVLSTCSARDLTNLAQVNRRLRDVTGMPEVWKHQFLKGYDAILSSEACSDDLIDDLIKTRHWRDLYFEFGLTWHQKLLSTVPPHKCIVLIHDKLYDVTDFVESHPGTASSPTCTYREAVAP